MMTMALLSRLKGKDRLETIENYCILLVIAGAVVLSSGIGLTAISTRGLPVLLAMGGALVSFLAIVALVFVWLAKDFTEK